MPYVSEQRIERCWCGQEGISTRGSCAAELIASAFGRDDHNRDASRRRIASQEFAQCVAVEER
jgi:hypothetical protein